MNPFSLVYDKLFQMASENELLGRYVKPGNMLNLNGRTEIPQSVSEADFPELVLTHTSLTGNLRASSARTLVQAVYGWLLTTGTWDLSGLTADLEWGLLTASSSWCQELTAVLWDGRPFITNVQLQTVDVTIADPERNRGIQGWSLTWPLLIDMYFDTNELRTYQWESTPANSGQSTE